MTAWTWDATHFTFDNANNHTFDGYHTHGASTPSDKVHTVAVQGRTHTVAVQSRTHTITGKSRTHTA